MFNLHIVIIHILNPEDVAVLVDMVRKVQSFFTRKICGSTNDLDVPGGLETVY